MASMRMVFLCLQLYGSLSAMRKTGWLLIFCLLPATAAAAGENTSTYTKFDLDRTCRQVEKGDEFIYAGAWRCKGYGGVDFTIASADAREFVGFGRTAASTCSYARTFNGFNTALSPVEWRLRNGKPFAAIQRWSVVIDGEGGKMTWLIVTALKGNESCPVRYVAGSYPNANAEARRAADDLAEGFDCATGTPTFASLVGGPDTSLENCNAVARE
jgi:hypothetical protein